MPKLGDFLGELLTEITMARVQADLEAVRVAELYAGHPLLKHMSVPRFRLPTVHLDVPVVIQGEASDDEQVPELEPEEAATRFLDVLDRVFDAHELRLLDDDREVIRRAVVVRVVEHIEEDSGLASSISSTVTDLIKVVMRTIRPRVSGGEESDEENGTNDAEGLLAQVREDLRRGVMTAFMRYVATPRRLDAEMSTTQVKEVGSREILARVRMEVSEDGVEWVTVVDQDGELVDRLVDE